MYAEQVAELMIDQRMPIVMQKNPCSLNFLLRYKTGEIFSEDPIPFFEANRLISTALLLNSRGSICCSNEPYVAHHPDFVPWAKAVKYLNESLWSSIAAEIVSEFYPPLSNDYISSGHVCSLVESRLRGESIDWREDLKPCKKAFLKRLGQSFINDIEAKVIAGRQRHQERLLEPVEHEVAANYCGLKPTNYAEELAAEELVQLGIFKYPETYISYSSSFFVSEPRLYATMGLEPWFRREYYVADQVRYNELLSQKRKLQEQSGIKRFIGNYNGHHLGEKLFEAYGVDIEDALKTYLWNKDPSLLHSDEISVKSLRDHEWKILIKNSHYHYRNADVYTSLTVYNVREVPFGDLDCKVKLHFSDEHSNKPYSRIACAALDNATFKYNFGDTRQIIAGYDCYIGHMQPNVKPEEGDHHLVVAFSCPAMNDKEMAELGGVHELHYGRPRSKDRAHVRNKRGWLELPPGETLQSLYALPTQLEFVGAEMI